MYDKRAKQDALDLWFSMPGEMSVDDFAAELGYPSGSTLRNWIKADPWHDPDKCQYRSKPVLPKLEAIRRVAEGATAAQAARETGLTPQQVRYSVGRYARGGTAALLPAPARKRRKGEAVDEGKTRRASRPARPMPCEQPPGLPEELPDDPAALKAIIADLELSNAALREVLAVLKAGAPALTNAEAAGCASRLEGAFGAAAACAALGLARSTYYYQLDALTSPSAPPDGTAGEVERASASTATRRGATGSCARSCRAGAAGRCRRRWCGGSCAGSGCACATRAGGATAPTPARSTRPRPTCC